MKITIYFSIFSFVFLCFSLIYYIPFNNLNISVIWQDVIKGLSSLIVIFNFIRINDNKINNLEIKIGRV
ncbi:MAG: hypothetical protein ACRCXY_03510 [Fusobacteriaceae bacterium]